MRGVLIAFEGIEGSGKTTQAKLLYSYLQEKSISCIYTQEPGGTAIGEQIRNILLDVKNKQMHRKTELLLYLANRSQHVHERLIPELNKGTVIITDRFSLSSMAYQGVARDFSFKVVSRLNKFAVDNVKPDLTILVDVPVSIGLKRTGDRSFGILYKNTKFFAPTTSPILYGDGQFVLRSEDNIDRLEKEKTDFHEKVRSAYLNLAKRAPKKIWVFSGAKSEQVLHMEIKEKVELFLTERGII
jgi:dTMP kinase